MKEWELRDQLYALGLGRKTVYDYLRAIQRAESWLQARDATLDDASPALLAAYVEQLPRSHASRNMARCAIAAYWRVTGRPAPPLGALRVPPAPRGICRALDEGDARLLVKTARCWDPHEQGPEGVAVLLGMYQALRRAEIAALQWEGFDPEGWLTVVGKGDVQRTIPVHPEVTVALAGWRQVRRPDPTDCRTRPGDVWVFAGRRSGTHVTPTTVWTWTRRVSDAAGLVPLQPHRMRHTCLAEINDRTGDLRTAQEIAGHAKPETTSRYTRTTAVRMRAAILAVDYGG